MCEPQGHSLGGAQATLAAWDIATSQAWAAADTTKLLRVVTFGSPRVGNREFAAAFNAALRRTPCFRVGNLGDPGAWCAIVTGLHAAVHLPTCGT